MIMNENIELPEEKEKEYLQSLSEKKKSKISN